MERFGELLGQRMYMEVLGLGSTPTWREHGNAAPLPHTSYLIIWLLVCILEISFTIN